MIHIEGGVKSLLRNESLATLYFIKRGEERIGYVILTRCHSVEKGGLTISWTSCMSRSTVVAPGWDARSWSASSRSPGRRAPKLCYGELKRRAGGAGKEVGRAWPRHSLHGCRRHRRCDRDMSGDPFLLPELSLARRSAARANHRPAGVSADRSSRRAFRGKSARRRDSPTSACELTLFDGGFERALDVAVATERTQSQTASWLAFCHSSCRPKWSVHFSI